MGRKGQLRFLPGEPNLLGAAGSPSYLPHKPRLACSPGLALLPTGWGAFGTTLFPSVEREKL